MCCCLEVSAFAFIFFVLYKLLDKLLRIPATSAPTAERDYILITGCDSGFGNLLAKRLDGKGFHVFASCLTQQGKDDLEARTSSRLKAVLMDITDQESVKSAHLAVKSSLPAGGGALIRITVALYSTPTFNLIAIQSLESKVRIVRAGLWAVVNNAGIANGNGHYPTVWMTEDDFETVMRVNFYGMIRVTNTFLPLLKRARGRIVNMSSIMGRLAATGVAYVASKYAIEGYSDRIRRELRPFGVTVHLIEPGSFSTSLTDTARCRTASQQTWEKLSQEIQQDYGQEYAQSLMQTKMESMKRGSPKLHLVIDAYEHAVLGAFPRARYLVGDDAKYLLRLLIMLPEWMSDWYLTRNAPVPLGAQKQRC